MSVELGITQAMILTAALYLWAAFKLDDRHSVFATFLFLIGLLWIPFTGFIARRLAKANNLDVTASILDKIFLAEFMVFFFALLYFGLVVYMNDTFQLVNRGYSHEHDDG